MQTPLKREGTPPGLPASIWRAPVLRYEGTCDVMIAVVASLCLIFIIMLGITGVVALRVIVGTVTSLGSDLRIVGLSSGSILHMPLHLARAAAAIRVMLAVGSDYNLLLIMADSRRAGAKPGMMRAMAGTDPSGHHRRTGVLPSPWARWWPGDLRGDRPNRLSLIMIGLLFGAPVTIRSYMTPAL